MVCELGKNRALEKAVKIAGGQSQLAKKCGVRQQTIFCWLKSGNVPAKRVIQIETIVNRIVTRHELRPDIYPYE